jgi:4-carboxymuconolactone decarboxylase
MKVFASMVTSAAAFAQAGGPPTSPSAAPQPSPPQISQAIKITRTGSQPPSQGPSERFTGSVRIDPLFTENPPAHISGRLRARCSYSMAHAHLGSNVDRYAWQRLGSAVGDQIQEIRPGDVVWVPPGVKHWHGATPTTSMTHIAVQESLNAKTVEWMEKVSDEQYKDSPTASEAAAANSKEPSAAQKLMGDFDPKLTELTDNVLYGDVWRRPGLSQRDRSLITVAVLMTVPPVRLRYGPCKFCMED